MPRILGAAVSLSRLLPLTASIFMVATTMSHAAPNGYLVFISAFADGDDAAIRAYQLNSESGELKAIERTTGIAHPFYMVVSPDRKFLYAIDAPKFGGQEDESITAFSIVGESGKLKFLNRQSTRGTASCYLDIDSHGKCVVVANYTTGSVAALPVTADGSLGPAESFVQHHGSSIVPDRQGEPHAHCMTISPDGKYVFAADLGIDQIVNYALDPKTSKLEPNRRQPFARTHPGAGPRHLTFHPNGRHAYVINELANSVTLFDYASHTGILLEQQTVTTLPPSFAGVSHCADIRLTPDGRFLYGTNRGHDSIAAYRVDDQGRLMLIDIFPSLGGGPQNLAITPDGRWLLCANMPGENIAVFRIDPQHGTLAAVGSPIQQPGPSCIVIM